MSSNETNSKSNRYENIAREAVNQNFDSCVHGHTAVIVTMMATAIKQAVEADRKVLLDTVKQRVDGIGRGDAASVSVAMAIVEDMQIAMKKRDA